MSTEGIDYRKEKDRRRFKFKEELTDFQRHLSQFNTLLDRANYLLIIIAMILFGIFLRLTFGG